MTFIRFRQFAATLFISLAFSAPALAQGKYGEDAPDFPAGEFNDGQRYQLSDFEGKVVVLFFYEKDCPTLPREDPRPQRRREAVQGQAGQVLRRGGGRHAPAGEGVRRRARSWRCPSSPTRSA